MNGEGIRTQFGTVIAAATAAAAAWAIAQTGGKRRYDRMEPFGDMDEMLTHIFRLLKTSVRWPRESLGYDARLCRVLSGLRSFTVEQQLICDTGCAGPGASRESSAQTITLGSNRQL